MPTSEPSKVVVVLSGGMDSAVLLTFYKALGYEVHTISFDYGQRHRRELESARAVAHFGKSASHTEVNLSSLGKVLGGSSQTDSSIPVPHGHYTDETMKKTVVPNRNMVMLSIAAGHAMSIKAETLAYGAHGGDHAIYPDCRPAFAEALAKAIILADWTHVRLAAPFIDMTKAQICSIGSRLGTPFEETWSCYDPQPFSDFGRHVLHCGKCGTCVERKEAFALAHVKDPTAYMPEPNVDDLDDLPPVKAPTTTHSRCLCNGVGCNECCGPG